MQKIDVKVLDKIVKQTIAAVEKGKSQIYDIYEAARNEMDNVGKDLERVKQETADIIFHVDDLEKRERRARLKLAEVHRNFMIYSEEDMRAAYEEVEQIRVELAVSREKEKNLRRQRDDLEQRLRNLQDTLRRAEGLVGQVGAALGFLGNHMDGVLTQIESMQQRQEFAAKIIRAQEEERRRVAREIHDGPAQSMANVVFRAEVCERLVDSDITRAKAELKDLQVQIREVLKETRKIIFGLRPMTLDDLGLVPTIRRVMDTMKERHGTIVELMVMGDEKRLDSHIEVGLFRIVQEALTNVEKHAQAKTVWVRLDFRRQLVSAVVEDDGRGFDADAENIGDSSYGIMGMQERITLLDGEISIKSGYGKGTKVYIKVPLK
ncbi:MAG: sensor histidine kinase [Negativicutes bacterium]|nr:sensor histidine kinase [Negativicutes bacterium]